LSSTSPKSGLFLWCESSLLRLCLNWHMAPIIHNNIIATKYNQNYQGKSKSFNLICYANVNSLGNPPANIEITLINKYDPIKEVVIIAINALITSPNIPKTKASIPHVV